MAGTFLHVGGSNSTLTIDFFHLLDTPIVSLISAGFTNTDSDVLPVIPQMVHLNSVIWNGAQTPFADIPVGTFDLEVISDEYRAEIKKNMVVRAQTQDVLRYIRAVVRAA
jgi:hypothetical protein